MTTVVLVEPRIPQNVGAVARLCAATAAPLHIVRPIPFVLNDRSLRRAGMDYMELVDLHVHDDWSACRNALAGCQFRGLSSHGSRSIYSVEYTSMDVLVFGSEEAGMPPHVMEDLRESLLKIPMPDPRAVCLNLATSVAICLYEAKRQIEGW
ncbi:MAG: tRNA (cytidine(34)-2'-O)-methyltransferase [Candidatus Sumerlaeia bacterium]|nr:tRNA (cytidine(34)-2'-O)-methyltransferase [Candidatus Sumerlaeia bacterium]